MGHSKVPVKALHAPSQKERTFLRRTPIFAVLPRSSGTRPTRTQTSHQVSQEMRAQIQGGHTQEMPFPPPQTALNAA